MILKALRHDEITEKEAKAMLDVAKNPQRGRLKMTPRTIPASPTRETESDKIEEWADRLADDLSQFTD